MIVKTYILSTTLPNGINESELHKDISNSACINNFNGVTTHKDLDVLEILGDSISNETSLDSIVTNHEKETPLEVIMKTPGDYKVKRNEMIIDVATRGFVNITEREKKLASKHFTVSKTDRDSVHTLDEQIDNGIDFHKQSVEARLKRRIAAEGEVYNRIQDGNEQSDLMNDVTNLLDLYVEFGIEGTLEGDIEGLFDYIESRVGTSYENTGLLSKTYTIEGMTISQLSTRLIDIFKNGNY